MKLQRLIPLAIGLLACEVSAEDSRPNILFCISDDQSWPHASAYGEPVIQTPTFDRVANEGLLFNHAYCAAPSCTPSRSAILTGQDIWRIGEGGQLFGTIPAAHPVFTDLLAANGYQVGYTRKGWGPGNNTAGGRPSGNPAGVQYSDFTSFFSSVSANEPWCFWFGSTDPHRGYSKGSGIASGMDPNQVRVPDYMPDTPEVRSDLCDYFWEIQRFDQDVANILNQIEAAGQLDNTIVVVTSDNGLPFPRGKATLYDAGSRMPLAIRWPDGIPTSGRTVDDFVNLTDLAPTFLEIAGVSVPAAMTGRSLVELLDSPQSGMITTERDSIVTARERHAYCRIDGLGYPSRMIRTHDYLYIRNYEPDRWPAGNYRVTTNEGNYGDVDASPSKTDMFNRIHEYPELYKLSFGKRPAEELYDCRSDPYQMVNLAGDPNHAAVLTALSNRLTAHLQARADPRETAGAPILWDSYNYYGAKNWPVLADMNITGLTASLNANGVTLEWVNSMDYAGIEVHRDGLVIEAALPGTETSYIDENPPTGGPVTYTLTPLTGTDTPTEIVIGLTPDDTAPPVPAFVLPPGPITNSQITLAANAVTDPDGNGVEYRFKNVSLATDSGWLLSSTWTDTGLSAGTSYTYTVQSRDTSVSLNESADSPAISLETLSTTGYTISDFSSETDLQVTGGTVVSAANFGSAAGTAMSPLLLNGISHMGFGNGSKNVLTTVGDADVLVTIGGSIGDFRGNARVGDLADPLYTLFRGIAASGGPTGSSGGTVGLDISGLSVGTEYLLQVYWEHREYVGNPLDLTIEGATTSVLPTTSPSLFSYRFTATDGTLNALFDYQDNVDTGDNNWISGYSLQVIPAAEGPFVATIKSNEPSSRFQLSWPSQTEMLYTVRSSPDLSVDFSTWTIVQDNIPASGTGTNTLDVDPVDNRLFYRVEESPTP